MAFPYCVSKVPNITVFPLHENTSFITLPFYTFITVFSAAMTVWKGLPMSEEKSIQVSMLGGCSLSYDGRTIDGKLVRSKRIWTLLEYLITYRVRCVPQDELIDLLYQEDKSGTPAGALKTLVHRAREALSRLGFADGKELIIKCAGGYRWNPEIPIALDTERFEKLLREASLCAADGEKQLQLRLEALELYRGDYLPEAATEIWAMSTATYFRFRYMKAVNEVLEALTEKERFDEVISLAGKAIAIDPYDEALYLNLILALVNMNRIQSAREQYESMTRLFYGELGVSPSKELQSLYKKLIKLENGVEKDLDVVSAELCGTQTANGAFFCEYEIFRDIFRLERSRAGRDGRSLHICLINAESRQGNPLTAKAQNTVMRRLCTCIGKNLRGGDVYSRYSVSQFIVMLPLASRESSEKVLERVARCFRRDNPHSSAAVTYSLRTVEPVQTSKA